MFKPFDPIHLEVVCRNEEYEAKCKLYITLTLERPLASFVDSVSTLVLNWADFNPLPANIKKFAVILTTDNYAPKAVPYIKLDLADP